MSRILVVGSDPLRNVVLASLPSTLRGKAVPFEVAEETARQGGFDAAILLHPEAAELVTTIHALMPVVVVTPESESLVEAYIAGGADEILFDTELDTLGRALTRAAARWRARASLDRDARLARIDPLTELPNRRALAEVIPRMTARAPCAAVLVDLDDFKGLNARLGYAGADRVLATTARVLERSLRPTDYVARYAGDEFIILLPGTDASVAASVADRVRVALLAEDVSASLGCAEIAGAPDLEAVLRATQDALHAAKAGGKGRIEVRFTTELAA